MSSSDNCFKQHHFLWLFGWTVLATVFFAGIHPATAAADCASDKGCYCGDGNCPTLGCCGGNGQRPCVTDDVSIFSSCSSVCNPGYHLDPLTASCRPACPSRDDGSCFTLGPCGRAGERSCALIPACDSGACLNGFRCSACNSRDDGLYFTLGPCGKSYERPCALVPACDQGYSFDDGYTSY